MQRQYLLEQFLFVIRFRYLYKWKGWLSKKVLLVFGMKIGKRTYVPKIYITWPHQVSIGENCNLEHGIYFKYDGIWNKGPAIIIEDNVFIGAGCEFNIRKKIIVGVDTLIASGCRFIDHNHGLLTNHLIRKQEGTEAEIIIGDDVWIGCNVVVLKGVTIGNGAVVAAGSVVTKSIPSLEIWGGVPAKKISER
jgi:acetyltransferase-like isoleucine patch superfamily enzyme